MRNAFQKSWRETRKENRLIKRMILESEKPRPRLGRNPYMVGLSIGYHPAKQ